MAALIGFARTYPLQTGAAVVVLVVLYMLSRIASREAQLEEQAAADARVEATIAGQLGEHLAPSLRELEAVAQRLTAAAPAVPVQVISPTGLPRPATLVGRERELDDLMARLRAGGAIGVFAVEGLPGVGKTALAAEAVARLAQDAETFPGGAAWVSCEGLEGEEGLAELWARVARALGADQVAALPHPEARRAALRAALADSARPRVLLALDNVEPGLNADALLDTLAGGQATLLLTARQAVAPARLRAVQLEPLPDPEAERLFTQRLNQTDSARPAAGEVGLVPAVAQLLGGLPLAVELAAAYVGVQRRSLSDLVAELKEEGVAGVPLRGLRARIDRSWALLTADQQRLFAGLSLLEGSSFPRDAALAVSRAAPDMAETDGAPGPSDGVTDERATLDLDALVSLALVEPQANGRLRLHPSLREYAGTKLKGLPAATAERLGDTMAAHWLAYARAHRGYEGMDALEAEAPGLMGALAWAYAHERWRTLLDLVYALNRAWFVRGRRDEERRFRPWAVEAARNLVDRRDQRFMVHALAVLDGQTGQVERARAGYEEALRLARELGDKAAQANELMNLGISHRQSGDLVSARAELAEALALAQQVRDALQIARTLNSLGFLARDQGDTRQACEYFREALARFEQLGSPEAEEPRDMLRELGCEP